MQSRSSNRLSRLGFVPGLPTYKSDVPPLHIHSLPINTQRQRSKDAGRKSDYGKYNMPGINSTPNSTVFETATIASSSTPRFSHRRSNVGNSSFTPPNPLELKTPLPLANPTRGRDDGSALQIDSFLRTVDTSLQSDVYSLEAAFRQSSLSPPDSGSSDEVMLLTQEVSVSGKQPPSHVIPQSSSSTSSTPVSSQTSDVDHPGHHLERQLVMGAMDQKSVDALAHYLSLGFSLRGSRSLERILKRLSDQDRLNEAVRVFDAAVAGGTRVSVICCNVVINACGKARQIVKAFEYFKVMRRMGLSPGVVTYSSLINACSKVRDLEGAFETYEAMLADGVAPNEIVYNSLINCCGKCGQVDRAFRVLEAMQVSGLTPDEFTWSTLIDVCGKASRFDKALDCYEAMKKSGVRPNEYSFNSLLGACAKANAVDEAFKIFDEMMAAGVPANEYVYNAIIHCCSKGGRVDKAFEYFESMTGQGIKPDQFTFSALLDSCIRGNQLDRAFCVFDLMRRSGVVPNEYIFNALMNAAGKSNQLSMAVDVLRLMQEAGVKPLVCTYNSLIEACAKSNMVGLALEVYDAMMMNGLKPDIVTYNTLLQVCAKGSRMDRARVLDLYLRMRQAGLAPDVQTYNNIFFSNSVQNTLGALEQAQRDQSLYVNAYPTSQYSHSDQLSSGVPPLPLGAGPVQLHKS
mmetsp:Transcript_43754/g.71139  ORF Transcript_43754/g.71139 Transcript_43754/m.71139 type:complete len:686 (+) Transcript_43754:154-2211(+)